MADIKLDPAEVPPELHPLIPYAEKWGIRDEKAQDNLLQDSSLSELEELYTALTPALDSVVRFVITFPSLDEPESKDAAIFDALWRAWREASHILNRALPTRKLLKLYSYPEKFTRRQLVPAKLPPELHSIIPLAEKWVLDDDVVRFLALEIASKEELEEFVSAMNQVGMETIRQRALEIGNGTTQNSADYRDEAYTLFKLLELAEHAEFLLRTGGYNSD